MDIAQAANSKFANPKASTSLPGTNPSQPTEQTTFPVCATEREAGDVNSSSQVGSNISTSTVPVAYEWKRLDRYAKIIQAHDEARGKDEKHAAQARMKRDLDKQVADVRARKEREKNDNVEYYKNLTIEIEQWKDYDQRVAEDRKAKAEMEKMDRDEQLQFDALRKKQADERRQLEDQKLLERIDSELEAEQRETMEKKMKEKLLIKELMRENEEERLAKLALKKAQTTAELRQLQEFNELVERQAQQREAELTKRVERQKLLIKKMEESVMRKQEEKSNDDNVRALKQQAERDARAIEVEAFKTRRLKELQNEMKETLRQQVEEKASRKVEEAELRNLHAQILRLDTNDFEQSEQERRAIKKKLVSRYTEQLNAQVASLKQKRQLDKDEMSRDEILLNRDLIGVVEKVLRDEPVVGTP